MPVMADWAHGPWFPCGPLGWLEDQVHSLSLDLGWRGLPQESAALGELLLAYPVGQEAEVAQPVEAVGWNMEHQPPQEFHGLEREGTQAVATLVILVAEGDQAVRQGDEPMVRDAHAMGIAGEILEHVLGLPEGLLGVDHPLLVT
jgi:hypothetical protein